MILVINTAVEPFFIGVSGASGSACEYATSRAFTEQLPETAEALLSTLKASFSDLTAVGVSVGPGSYTGIRIGVSVAKSIGQLQDIPVFGLSTFDCFDEMTPDSSPFFVVFPSRKGHLNCQFFSGGPVSDAYVQSEDDFVLKCRSFSSPILVAGIVSESLHSQLDVLPHVSLQRHSLSAEVLYKMINRSVSEGKTSRLSKVMPVYAYKAI